MTELRWLTSPLAGATRACGLIVLGTPLSDGEAEGVLAPLARELASFLETTQVASESFFLHLVPLAVGEPNPVRLAQVALAKAVGRARAETLSASLANILRKIERATAEAFPESPEAFALRAGPLREQWEAYGPGLLRAIGRKTEENLLPARADVVLLQPVQGGGGEAYLPYNVVGIEAVLVNATPQAPEVLRLAWLLSQLEHDRPAFGDYVSQARLPRLAALAMLPPALAAAAELEIVRDANDVMPLALEAWRLGANDNAALSEALVRWWETYEVDRPPWAIALAALEKILEEV